MKTVILIPARSGSKRIPYKNIKELGGIPLMVYSIITGQELGIETWVSSDSFEYLTITTKYGAKVITRPTSLCTDKSSDYDVVKHFISKVECDLVIYLRPTTPFRSSRVVLEALKLMVVPGYDSLRSVHEMAESAYKCFRIKAGILQPLTKIDLTDRPNQAVARTYHPNGYVDIVRREIVERGSLWGAGRYAFITPRVPEIDTPEDWEYAEWYATNKMRRWNIGKADVS
jgi:CMP-N-acetylneuraminic acid synthetase